MSNSNENVQKIPASPHDPFATKPLINEEKYPSRDEKKNATPVVEVVIEDHEGEEYFLDDNPDRDSLDEGLGDISSDEVAESPVPNKTTDDETSSSPNVLDELDGQGHSRISLETSF